MMGVIVVDIMITYYTISITIKTEGIFRKDAFFMQGYSRYLTFDTMYM